MKSNSNTKTKKSRGKRAKKNLSRVLKLIIVVLCFIGFVYNSFYTFKQFIGNQTVTSHNIQEHSELYLPSITLCGTSGYKTMVERYADLEIENYNNNTVKLTDLLIEVGDNDNGTLTARPLVNTLFDELGRWKILTTYSAYRGRCYTIEYRKKVRWHLN